MKNKYFLEKLTTYLFYLSILFFLIAFNFQDSKTSGWYQQFMPNLGGRQIIDITFTDSLTGYAITPYISMTDSAFILKTTNGGDNWFFILKQVGSAGGGFRQIRFINQNTGFVCGNLLKKTTNQGINWNTVNTSGIFPENMCVISNDTIWLSDTDPLVGGMFRTTNGGANWQKLDNGVNQPWPDKIYFYNNRLGFASNYSHLYRTTNSGVNWSMVTGTDGYNDIVFSDSLTGYKTYDSVRKTTNGGLNWIAQQRPKLNFENSFYNFSLINKDTIWGCGGSLITSLGYRGVIYKTTNGGLNWGYQLPDTININIARYIYSDFINKKVGWEYISSRGVHTTVGGNDTTFYTGIKEQITNNISTDFILYQNYPNPFNSVSSIKYKISKTEFGSQKSEVRIIVYDIQGKQVKILVNKKQSPGEYEVKFDASSFSSGIYFYSLFIDGNRVDTKKMILIK